MLTIFNRKEVCITYHTKEQWRVRDILSDHNIKYLVKTTSRAGTGRGRAFNSGSNTEMNYCYKIYVHQNDYEKAKFLIGK